MTKLKSYKVLAKMGYVARGVIYLIIGLLALSSAIGWENKQANSKGAVLSLKSQPFGELLLIILVAGLVGYIVWRLIQAITDTEDLGHSIKGLGIRLGLLFNAITHCALTYWIIILLFKDSDNASDQSASSTISQSLDSDLTALVFGVIGLVMAGIGIAQFFQGFTARFEQYLDIPENKARWLIPVCQFGFISRGVVWCIIGWIVLRSAFVAGYSDDKGVDDAFQWLNTTPFGTSLTIIVSIGFIAFAVFSFVEAVYHRIKQ